MTRVTHAFVLGAGLGTRLMPLTSHRPKPLIPVINRPLISYAFDHLVDAGVERLVVNTHWRGEAYATAFPNGTHHGTPIAFRHEAPEVLETAGGIKNVEDLLSGGPFWVYNGDILCDLSLKVAERTHFDCGNEVTLVLRSKDGPLQVALDEGSGRITDISHRVDPASDLRFLFTGIYIVNPEFLARIPHGVKLSVIPIFCEMIRTGARLGGVVIDDGHWWDLGTREKYLDVHQRFAESKPPIPDWLHPAAQIDPGALVNGASTVGAGAKIGAGARLHDCIIWPGAEVAPGAVLERCIVATGARAEGTHTDKDFA
jgi:NDP-sugar pyrophosphorylase family protein